uniref:cystatin-B-like n=1 Tax=Pristiophorus japonicus TaxID=55135 RepID=UPI00398F7073
MSQQKMCCGGTSGEKSPTPEIQQMAESLKSQIEEKANKTFAVFVVKSFKSQVVSGTNYFMKIHVGGEDYLHARIFEDLPCRDSKLELAAIKTDKLHHDEIIYF